MINKPQVKRFIVHPSRLSPEVGSVTITVDAQDAHWLRNHSWSVCDKKHHRIITTGPLTATKGRATLQHAIMGAGDTEVVEFITEDKLDFRRTNLRVVSSAEHMQYVGNKRNEARAKRKLK